MVRSRLAVVHFVGPLGKLFHYPFVFCKLQLVVFSVYTHLIVSVIYL
jgi:hypothetical protein